MIIKRPKAKASCDSSPPQKRGLRHFNNWIPAIPGNCSCIAGTPAARGGRAGTKNTVQKFAGLLLGLGLAFTFTCNQATAAAPAIPLYHATYAVKRNDLHIGNAQFSLSRNDNGTYTYQSVTRASGLASLLFSDVITETSYFALDDGHLQPLLYSYMNTRAGHDQTIRFNWGRDVAESNDEGKQKDYPIKLGIYDRALAQLALSIDMATGHLQSDYRVLDHGEFQNYRMRRGDQGELSTPAGSYDTVQVIREDVKKHRVTTFWFAPKLDYLPVQMQQTEPGKATISLVLMEIKFDIAEK